MSQNKNRTIVSVIMPCFNAGKYIGKAIESVLNQSFQELELIIVNDASTDNSTSIIENHKRNDPRIKFINLIKNVGGAHARNKGIDIATGKYIAFLDADDLWFPNKLKSQIDFMNQTGAVFAFSSYEKIDSQGNLLGVHNVKLRQINYRQLLKRNTIGCLTAIYNCELSGKFYLPDIKRRQDYGLWLKILKAGNLAYGQPEVLAQYRVHDASLSANKVLAAVYQWKLFREIEQLNVFSSIYYFWCYLSYNLKKRMWKPSK